MKGIVLLVGLGNACIAFLCAFTLVQIDFIRRQNITRQTNGIQLRTPGVNLDGIAPVWVLGSLALKPSGALLESIPSAASASELPVSAAAARISSRAAYAGDKSQCQSKAYAAFEFHGIFLLFLFCGAVERAAAAEKRLKIAAFIIAALQPAVPLGHTKCPIFDTKYTDRKNRVNYA